MASFLSFFRTIRLLASSDATACYRPAPGRTDGIPDIACLYRLRCKLVKAFFIIHVTWIINGLTTPNSQWENKLKIPTAKSQFLKVKQNISQCSAVTTVALFCLSVHAPHTRNALVLCIQCIYRVITRSPLPAYMAGNVHNTKKRLITTQQLKVPS